MREIINKRVNNKGRFTYTPERKRKRNVTENDWHCFVFGRPFTFEPNPRTESLKMYVYFGTVLVSLQTSQYCSRPWPLYLAAEPPPPPPTKKIQFVYGFASAFGSCFGLYAIAFIDFKAFYIVFFSVSGWFHFDAGSYGFLYY